MKDWLLKTERACAEPTKLASMDVTKTGMGNGEWGMRFLTYIDVEMPHLSYTTLTLTVRVKVSSYIKPA